jgi:2,5-dihydroxypyridine 5,6-dioxygenase
VLITADSLTDPHAVAALQDAAAVQNAKTAVLTIPQLPFQGALADPYIPEPVAAAVMSCDVWLDLTFPYIAGSQVHDKAMKTNRVRTLLFHDLDNGGIARLFGGVDFDRLFALQNAFDAVVAGAVGKQARVTTTKGTDVTFTIAKPATKKIRHIDQPGTFTPPGSAVIYPEPASVKGRLVVEAVFHEYYTLLKSPISMNVDGKVREISGGGPDLKVMDRALRRAGRGNYGSIIHFSHGFHPAARFNGQSFIEDVRAAGNDAVGLGIPWWEPGGGENHPDAVVTMQTLWIDGKQMVRDGAICGSPELIRLETELNSNLR